jgi:hypothetical protein
MLCDLAQSLEFVAMVHQGDFIAEMMGTYMSQGRAGFACGENILQGKVVEN